MGPEYGGGLARLIGWGVRVSLCSFVAALFVGVGGYFALAPADDRPGDHPSGARAGDLLRLALPQRSPADFLPPPALVDETLPPRALRTDAVRQQNWRALQDAAAARAEAAIVRSQALQLRVATPEIAEPTVTAAAAAPAPVAVGSRVQVTLSYYYCSTGPSGRRVGDGGGFCGAMRNGQRVYAGAAACAARYLGQRFRIVGDPSGRTYTCADTGSAVHGEHRDIWFNTADAGRAWQQAVGNRGVIEIVR